MSRGFDGLEIDDFHGPERDGNRSPDSDSRSGWAAVRRLERIRGGRNVPTSVTRKPAEPLAATVPLYHRPRWRTTFSRSRSPREVQSRAWKK